LFKDIMNDIFKEKTLGLQFYYQIDIPIKCFLTKQTHFGSKALLLPVGRRNTLVPRPGASPFMDFNVNGSRPNLENKHCF